MSAPTADRQPATRPLDRLFRPRGIAVVGASADMAKPGGRCLAFLRRLSYAGEVYAVNPRYEAIGDVACYPDVDALPTGVDLVVLTIPAASIAEAVRAAGRRGIGAAIVCSSGFAESGPAGEALEAELARAAAEAGVAVVGPNSLGILDLNANLAATFSTSLQLEIEMKPGPVALVSQSGAMGAAIFALAQQEGVPVGAFLSTGNEAVLGFADYVAHLAEDPNVSVILGYVEGVRDGRRLLEAARHARENGKTVALLKAGRTAAGAKAARSHTGALTGDAKVYGAAFRRAGIVTARSPRELLDAAIAFVPGRLPRGNRVGIVSMSGGSGAMMADRCSELGFELAALSEATVAAVLDVLPPFSGVDNPVDYGAAATDPDAIEQCVRAVASDPGVDTVVVFIGLSPLLVGDVDLRLEQIRNEIDKPVVVGWLGDPPGAIASLRGRGIPAYEDPIRAVEAAAALLQASVPLTAQAPPGDGEAARDLRARIAAAGASELGERETRALLEGYGVRFVPDRLVQSADEAVAAARQFGVPVAVKAAGLLHKSDSGGVRLGVEPDDAGEAFADVTSSAAVGAAVVQPMAAPGLELLVGAKRDPQFGPVVAVGLGGVASEALADVAVDLAPVTRGDALALLRRLRGAALLGPFRGRPPRDVDAVADVLVEVGRFAADAGDALAELDLNPVVVYAETEGCLALDAAAVVEEVV